MNDRTLQLHGADRLRYFAPVLLCACLAVLCLATAAVSLVVTHMRDTLAVTASALFGFMGFTGVATALLRLQLRWLRYLHIPLRLPAQAAWEAIHELTAEAGWRILHEQAGRRLVAVTPGTVFEEGERVAVEFDIGEVRVASICDPAVGFTLTGHRRCRQHCERVRRALLPG